MKENEELTNRLLAVLEGENLLDGILSCLVILNTLLRKAPAQYRKPLCDLSANMLERLDDR